MPRSCHRQHTYCSIPLSQPYRMTYLVRAASPRTAPGHLYMAAWLCACSLQMRRQRDTHLGSDFQRRSRDPLYRSAYPQETPVTPPQRRYKWLRTPPRSSLRRLPSCHDSVFPHVHPQTHTHARIDWVKLGERDTSVARRPMVGGCQRSGKGGLVCIAFFSYPALNAPLPHPSWRLTGGASPTRTRRYMPRWCPQPPPHRAASCYGTHGPAAP